MHSPRRRHMVALTVLFAGLSVAPAAPRQPAAPQQPAAPRQPAGPSPLAEARYRAAVKQFEIIWSYYQQARIDSFEVYLWSRLLLDSRREMSETPADRRAALEAHLGRMKRMEELVKKIRRLGFGRSSDVGATEYYRLEAEHWLARAGEEKR